MNIETGKLAEALAKAQGEMQNAAKDKDNPFFKSTYADLASVWDACRAALSKNGLCVVQPFEMREGKIFLITKLMHSSGEQISSEILVQPVKGDPQSIGSALTYFRRFALSALVGIAPAETPTEADVDDDDDGNAASARQIIANHKAVHGGVPPSIIKPKQWVISADDLDKLKEQCSKIGWDGKRLVEQVKLMFDGKNSLTKLTETEYLNLFNAVMIEVDKKNPQDPPEWEKELGY